MGDGNLKLSTNQTIVVCCALICLAAYSIVALIYNVNHLTSGSVVGAVTFIVGLAFGVRVTKK